MKRKQSLIGGLDRILSVREASNLLSIPVDGLLKFYAGQREISLSNLLKRICRSNPIYHFPIIGEPTYTLKGVMSATGKGRSWSLFFLERNCVRTWCLGVHYLYSKADVDNAWRKESINSASSSSRGIWVGYPGCSATDCKRVCPCPSRTKGTTCFT